MLTGPAAADRPLDGTVSADFAVPLKLCVQKLSSDQDGVTEQPIQFCR